MKPRTKSCIAAVAVMVLATLGLALPAGAAVDSNPNASETVNIVCEDGTTFDSVLSPRLGKSVMGHDLDGNRIVVATSAYATIGGVPVGVLYDRPGVGLDQLTVWCVWEEPLSPTGQAGSHVLIVGRP